MTAHLHGTCYRLEKTNYATETEKNSNQRIRRFLADALGKGRIEDWEREPTVPTADRFVRRGDLFPEIERRGYVDYEDR